MAQTVYHRPCGAADSAQVIRRPTEVELAPQKSGKRRADTWRGQKRLVRFMRGTLCALIGTLFLWKRSRSVIVPLSHRVHESPPSHKLAPLATLKHAHQLLSAPITTVIEPKPDWMEQPYVQYGYPVREVWSSEQMCEDDEDFNYWIRVRTQRWQKPKYLEEHGIWQAAIGDKLGGYLFARKMGVRVPHIDFCTGNGPELLSQYDPPKDKGFVVKNLYGHSSQNVYVMESGFGGINRINDKKMSLKDIQGKLKRANATDIYVEELIESGRPEKSIPEDYKFYTFNGKVENIRVIRNRGTERFCMAFYDEHWNRHDEFGCFKYAEDKPKGNKTDPQAGCYPVKVGAANNTRRFCSNVPPPKNFPKMLETAKRLSKRIGVFMRIDMFENADGEVVLGEFTPFSSYGGYHCSAKVVDGCVDSCFLGKAWKENSLTKGESYQFKAGWEKRHDGKMVKMKMPRLEGGPITSAPKFLKDWGKLSMHEKCARIKDL